MPCAGAPIIIITIIIATLDLGTLETCLRGVACEPAAEQSERGDHSFVSCRSDEHCGPRLSRWPRTPKLVIPALVRLYYGVLAPRAPWRAEVVASAASEEPQGAPATEPRTPDGERSDGPPPPRPGAYLWADLMRRTFGFDVLQCPRCGGRLRLLALIEHASAAERILRHLGLPTDLPEPRPSRAPPRRIQNSDRHWDDGPTAFDATF